MMMWIMLSINLCFFFMKHPLAMGGMLFCQTIMVALMTGILMKSFWMSFIIMIMMLSGLLVLFMYMSSTASNKKFMMNKKLIFTIFLMFSLTLLLLKMENKMIIKNNYFMMEVMSFSKFETQPLSKMYLHKNSMVTIFMILYLFYTMIISNHLVSIEEGPMRTKFYE